MDSGKITGSTIEKNIDSETPTQVFQIEGPGGKDDGQTPEEMHVPNLQYKPVNGARAFFARIARGAWKICTGVDDHVPKFALNEGECLLYSHDGSEILGRIYITKDSKISIGDGTEEVLDLMNQMLTEFKTLVSATMLNGTVDAPGVASTGTNGVISALLTQMGTDLTTIETKLGTLKV